MAWRSGTEASTRSRGLAALAGPVCGVFLLLAAAQAPAQTEKFPPAWVPPRPPGNGYYYQTSWRRQTLAETQPPASLDQLAPATAALTDARVSSPTQEPAAATEPATILQCSALEESDVDDDTPVFPIQLRLGERDRGGRDSEDGIPSFTVEMQPPGSERVFRLESEAHFQERIRQETPRRPFEPVVFPEEPVLSESNDPPRRVWPPRETTAEANYVCYGPLMFQQKNFERYGWDLGAITPLVSLMAFWYDGVTFPYHLAAGPCLGEECSAGHCLPGDPVPLLLWPPRWPVSFQVNYYRTGSRP
jgi:hypothetical protein